MKLALIAIGISLLLVLIIAFICVQVWRAYRNAKKKLDEANREIEVLKQRVENEKKKQEIANDEQRKADKDKETLHTGSNTDKFDAANAILQKHKD